MAGLVSLVQLLLGRHPVPVGDARDYLDAALSFIPDSGRLPNEMAFSQLLRAPWYIFTLTSIGWLFYHPFGEAGLIFSVQLFQKILYAANIGLIFAVVRQLGYRPKVAGLASILALLYSPFLQMTDRLLVETEVLTCVLAFFLFWLHRQPVYAGVMLFLGLSNSNLFTLWPKVFLMLLPVGAAFYLYRQEEGFGKRLLKCVACVVIGALLLHLITIILPHSSFPPATLWYYGDTVGWAPLVPINGMVSLLQTNGSEIFAAYVQNKHASVDDILRWVLQQPERVLWLIGTNMSRLFARPDDVYHQSWAIFQRDGLLLYHQVLVAGAFLSVPLVFRENRFWILLLLPFGWLVYTLAHIEARYNLPLMAGLIILFSCGIATWHKMGHGYLRNWTMGLLGVLALVQMPFYPFLKSLIPLVSIALYELLILLVLCVLTVLTVYRLLPEQIRLGSLFVSSRLISLWIGLMVLLPLLCRWSLLPPDTEWFQVLKDGETGGIRQTVRIPSEFWEPENMTTYLVLDTRSFISPWQNDLAITVNGYPVTSQSKPPRVLSDVKTLLGGLLSPEVIRQYRLIPLPEHVVDTMRNASQTVIRVHLNKHVAQAVAVYGDYPIDGKEQYVLPNPDWGMFSVYKSQYDGDGRLPMMIKSQGQSERIDMNGNSSSDLSTRPGLQTGRYRIFFYRLLPEDASNLQMPVPAFRLNPLTGQLAKTFRIAY